MFPFHHIVLRRPMPSSMWRGNSTTPPSARWNLTETVWQPCFLFEPYSVIYLVIFQILEIQCQWVSWEENWKNRTGNPQDQGNFLWVSSGFVPAGEATSSDPWLRGTWLRDRGSGRWPCMEIILYIYIMTYIYIYVVIYRYNVVNMIWHIYKYIYTTIIIYYHSNHFISH